MNEDSINIQLARGFGCGAHVGRKYGNGHYRYHLEDVYQLVIEVDLPEVVAMAAWLHDTIEDTPTTHSDLKDLFGRKCADLVWAVTNDPDPAPGYKQRTYAKIAGTPLATELKLCDRIANVEASVRWDNVKMLKKYRADQDRLVSYLWESDGDPYALWKRLNKALGRGC